MTVAWATVLGMDVVITGQILHVFWGGEVGQCAVCEKGGIQDSKPPKGLSKLSKWCCLSLRWQTLREDRTFLFGVEKRAFRMPVTQLYKSRIQGRAMT